MPNYNESVVDEAHRGLKIIVPQEKSRPVRWRDLWRVFIDSTRIKLAMISPFPGRWSKAASISHCQIAKNDPLRFFVVDSKLNATLSTEPPCYFGNRIFRARTIINPVILGLHGQRYKNKEACMSFPFSKKIPVKRNEIAEVEYWTIWGKKRRRTALFFAAMVQHEIEHMNLAHPLEKYARAKK